MKWLCKIFGHKWEWFVYRDVLGKMPWTEYAQCKRCKKEAWDYDEL